MTAYDLQQARIYNEQRHRRDSSTQRLAEVRDRLDKFVDKVDQSTDSENSENKGKMRDIVFEPAQRKRLLDGLNIVTPRLKQANLSI